MVSISPVIAGAEGPAVSFKDGVGGFTVSLESPQQGDTYHLWMTASGGTEADLADIDDVDDLLSIVKYVDFVRINGDVEVLFDVKCPEGVHGKYGVRIIRSTVDGLTEDTYYTYTFVDPNLAVEATRDYMAVDDDTTFAELFEKYYEKGLFKSDNLGVLADEDVLNSIGSDFAIVRDLVLGADGSEFEAVPYEILSCAASTFTYNALLSGDIDEIRTEIAKNGAWMSEYLPADENLENYMRIFEAAKDVYEDGDGLRDILEIACEYSAYENSDKFLDVFDGIDEEISDADKLKNMLDWSVALSGLEGATRDEIAEILEENAELFGISTNSEDIGDVTIAQIARIFKNTGVSSLYGQEAFSEYYAGLIDELTEDDEEDSKRGGSGSRGGSKGPSKYVADPVIPADNTGIEQGEKKEEVNLPFTDLNGVEWATEYIAMLYDMGIINGVSKDSFEPNRQVTREEYVKMLVVAFDLSADKVMDFVFNDVNEENWSYPYIKAAYLSGVVNGMSKDYFGAKEPITREDAAVMLYKAMGIEVPDAELAFSDADAIADYAKDAIAALSSVGLMTGMEDGTFAPLGQTTRAQAATMIGRAISYDGGGM